MRRGRKIQVVDTNVLVVANRREGGSFACARNCTRALLGIKNLGVIVLDDVGHILSEYRRYCSVSGQPGVGDSFMKWVHDNSGRAELVRTVRLTSKEGRHQFEEFPDHPDLCASRGSEEVGERNKPEVIGFRYLLDVVLDDQASADYLDVD